MSQKLVVENIKKDRFARSMEITLGEKTIQTPNFCTLIRNSREFKSLQRLSLLEETEFLGSYIIRIFDTLDTILPTLENQLQRVLPDRSSIEELFVNFNKKNVTLIDPSTEYLLYEFFTGKFPRVLRKIRQKGQLDILLKYLEECVTKKEEMKPTEYKSWKRASHRKFWYSLDRNQQDKSKFVGDFVDLQNKCGSDVIIPPVPIIDSEGMLDIAMRINKLTRAIAPRTKQCATYLLLQKGVLKNDSLVQKIVAMLREDPTLITMVKIKNLDLWNSGRIAQKENYKKLMDTMFRIREGNPNKIYIALENWYQCFASACYGFDIVSSRMHGYDKDSDFGKNTFGSWFDPDLMYYIPFDDFKSKTIKNNHNVIPCYCSVCKQISDIEEVDRDSWYLRRREHFVLTMNEYMKMIRRAVTEKHIELAREKIVNSDVSGLKSLIPRTI